MYTTFIIHLVVDDNFIFANFLYTIADDFSLTFNPIYLNTFYVILCRMFEIIEITYINQRKHTKTCKYRPSKTLYIANKMRQSVTVDGKSVTVDGMHR